LSVELAYSSIYKPILLKCVDGLALTCETVLTFERRFRLLCIFYGLNYTEFFSISRDMLFEVTIGYYCRCNLSSYEGILTKFYGGMDGRVVMQVLVSIRLKMTSRVPEFGFKKIRKDMIIRCLQLYYVHFIFHKILGGGLRSVIASVVLLRHSLHIKVTTIVNFLVADHRVRRNLS